MSVVALILQPLIDVMRLIFEAIFNFVGSYGFSIILFSAVMRVVTMPISRWARRVEAKYNRTLSDMEPELVRIRSTSKGRERFERIDGLYEEHGFHPIMAVSSILPLLFQLPFLLAALILFTGYPALQGVGFFLIDDLARPDQLMPLAAFGIDGALNVLPILIAAVTIIESACKANATKASVLKFCVIAVTVGALIYPLAAAACLYWLSNAVFSFLAELVARRRNEATP